MTKPVLLLACRHQGSATVDISWFTVRTQNTLNKKAGQRNVILIQQVFLVPPHLNKRCPVVSTTDNIQNVGHVKESLIILVSLIVRCLIDITPDLRLILVGSQRYGADWVANTILGGAFEWGIRTAQSVTHTGQVNGKVIQLVKAPVWLRGYHLCDTAELVKEELVLSANPGPHAFILLIEADLPFTSACAKAVKAHLELFGEDVWSHIIVLFTCVDWLGNTDMEEYIAGEGEGLKQLLKRCGQRYEFASVKECQTLSERLLKKVQMLLQSNEGRHFEVKENVLQTIEKKREEVNKKAEIRRRKRIKDKKTQESGW